MARKLSKRLQAVADFVTAGSQAADVGTDHGFLPIYLVQSGKCPSVIAMDIRKGPLACAQEHIAAAGLEDYIYTRLSDGLQQLSVGEADSIIIAGMGGCTVMHILDAGMELVSNVKELILGPQSEIAGVRMYLREHGMYIDKEELVYEDGKFYPVLHIVMQEPEWKKTWKKNAQELHERFVCRFEDEDRVIRVLDQYGANLIYAKHPMLKRLLERDEKREINILQGLESQRNAKRRMEVERSVEEIHLLQDFFGNVGEACNRKGIGYE